MDSKDEIEEFVDATMQVSSASEESEDETNEVFDLNVNASSDESDDDDDDDDDDVDSEVEQERRIRRALGSSDEEEEDDEEGDSEAEEIGWGKRKTNFYGADNIEEDEEAEMEEKEALRLQKKQLAELDEDDFEVPEEGSDDEREAKEKSRRLKKSIGSDVLDIANAAALGENGEAAEEVVTVGKDVSGMNKKDQIRLLMKNSPELLGLLEDLRSQSSDLSTQIAPILQEVEAGLLPTSDGVSYLEVKSHLMLTYLINLTFYLLLKAEGKSVKDHPVISQLVQVRSLLEQTRPLDTKLKNQIDRILALATDAAGAGAARPHPEELVTHEEDEEEQGTAAGVYRVPKRMAVPYTGDAYSREEQKAERAKEKLRKSKLLRELRSEFSEAPEVFEMEHKDKITEKAEEQEMERQRYEEENFTRLPMTKEQKKLEKAARQRHARFDILGDLENFGDLDKLMEQAEQGDLAGSLVDEEREKAKKKLLKHTVNEIETAERGRMQKILNAGGDMDLPRKDANTLRANYYRRAAAESSDEDEPRKRMRVESSAMAGDDDVYIDAARRKAERERKKKEAADERAQQAVEAVMSAVGADMVDGKRKASQKIVKNKGLTKYRRSDLKAPRARQRHRYEKAVKRRRGQVPDMRTDVGNYMGETTGIRKTLTRSRKIVG